MPINIPADLPAYSVLKQDNIFVMSEERAKHQDIRPLQIAIVNLMPTKIATETQLLRLLGNSPVQVDITLIRAEHHVSKIRLMHTLSDFIPFFLSCATESSTEWSLLARLWNSFPLNLLTTGMSLRQ